MKIIKKSSFYLVVSFLLVMGLSLTAYAQIEGQDTLFQISTIDALLQGLYDGDITVGQLLDHGNFGLGTFHDLDGEMVILDGVAYQVKSTGEVKEVSDIVKTPFAVATYFDEDKSAVFKGVKDIEELKKELTELLPSKNIFYAIKIEGEFKHVKTRSVPKQSKPYPKLAKIAATQPTFDFYNTKGTLVGFWSPYYVNGINVPKFHLHFINEDRTGGGHLLECQLKRGEVQIDYSSGFQLILPHSNSFRKIKLNEESGEDLEDVEE
ncbi:acetolactate decarboxylase [Orenia metallireducens]|jgi:acetolactate decarboxylase|uniref:Alpha-acetolactate decarboxylase n=1 Tax=Orenia metallireducens TaxID=1413210 RepID=A0A285FY35_9FIRM|nr:acetolactate decarboxylase [Orenia metallireducens]PRX35530.1 acetolactate decarboxylase [Orenia metallireducens]SNY16187.1 acetolactate decarboxylase [Orenia metallireducens]